jgi:flagellar biosynthetic protein FliP
MISELKRAFEIGFLLFLPFLIIDLVVASVLMSMGMMMRCHRSWCHCRLN